MVYLDRALPQHGVVEPHGGGDSAIVGELHEGESLVRTLLGAPPEVLNLPRSRGEGVHNLLRAGVGPDVHHNYLKNISIKTTCKLD